MRQPAVIGQKKQAFAIPIEPADRINPRHGYEVLEVGPALDVRELGKDVVGFVEDEVTLLQVGRS